MKYDKHVLGGYLVGGMWREAIDYLRMFPSKQAVVRRMEKRTTSYVRRSDNEFINRIDAIFQEYYKKIFWLGESREDGALYLSEELLQLVSADELQKLFGDTFGSEADSRYADVSTRVCGIEELLSKAVAQEGYFYLGGDTQGFFGPYIRKTTTPVTYRVELPAGTQELTVRMMEGFVSRSWLDYLSAGKIGAGGWAKDGELFCVKHAYASRMDSPAYLVSYLKHEAQHVYDAAHFPGISAVQLEYRAKLIELIYYPNILRLKSFLAEASANDPRNSHAYASYLVVGDLSRRVFQQDYVSDYGRWKGKLHPVQDAAKACFTAFSV